MRYIFETRSWTPGFNEIADLELDDDKAAIERAKDLNADHVWSCTSSEEPPRTVYSRPGDGPGRSDNDEDGVELLSVLELRQALSRAHCDLRWYAGYVGVSKYPSVALAAYEGVIRQKRQFVERPSSDSSSDSRWTGSTITR